MPAKAGIQWSGGALYSGSIHTLRRPPWRGHHSADVMPAKAGIQWSGGALLSGGIHTLHRPPWRGIHILPSTPSGRPPQPTVMPAEGDLCVTPPVGDSVAEMASIPSGEPQPWILACAGMTVVQRSPEAGIQWSGGALLSGGIHTLRQPPWRGHHSAGVMPAKAGIQWSGGHATRRHPHPPHPHPPSTSLARHPYSAVNPFGEAATAYRHARGRRRLRNSPCGRQRGGDG